MVFDHERYIEFKGTRKRQTCKKKREKQSKNTEKKRELEED